MKEVMEVVQFLTPTKIQIFGIVNLHEPMNHGVKLARKECVLGMSNLFNNCIIGVHEDNL